MSGAEVDLTRYLQSEAESQRIFEEEIVPDEMAGSVTAEQPVVLFVAGQPGAGKTRTTDDAIAAFDGTGEGVVVVNSDTYKPYHPKWSELLAADDVTAALYTRLDDRRWMQQAYDWAAVNRRNVIVETTMQGPDVFEDPVAQFRGTGYRVEVQALAVPAALSSTRHP
ncbi:MAG: zeta toxin family protein [Dermatophilaceae bacterium]